MQKVNLKKQARVVKNYAHNFRNVKTIFQTGSSNT